MIQWEVQEVMSLMKTMATPRKPLLCDYLVAFYNNAVEARYTWTNRGDVEENVTEEFLIFYCVPPL